MTSEEVNLAKREGFTEDGEEDEVSKVNEDQIKKLGSGPENYRRRGVIFFSLSYK